MSDQAFWQQRDGVYHPTVVPHLQSEHKIRLKVVGTLMVLTLLLFGGGAPTVCPLLYTLLYKKMRVPDDTKLTAEHLGWSLEFLSKLDEDRAMTMVPWMVLKHEGESPKELKSLLSLFAQCELLVSCYRGFMNSTSLTVSATRLRSSSQPT